MLVARWRPMGDQNKQSRSVDLDRLTGQELQSAGTRSRSGVILHCAALAHLPVIEVLDLDNIKNLVSRLPNYLLATALDVCRETRNANGPSSWSCFSLRKAHKERRRPQALVRLQVLSTHVWALLWEISWSCSSTELLKLTSWVHHVPIHHPRPYRCLAFIPSMPASCRLKLTSWSKRVTWVMLCVSVCEHVT